MEPVDRTSENLRGLLTDLDEKLGRETTSRVDTVDASPTQQRKYTRGLPVWAALIVVTMLILAAATLVVRPFGQRCSYSGDLCKVEQLDIDALRIAVPESDLLSELPNIDALDPDDVLTVGDIFAMERFQDLDVEALLSPEEIDVLLAYVD